MKPFSLKEAIEGKPLITRDGCEAVFISYDSLLYDSSKVICRVKLKNDRWVLILYREDGKDDSGFSGSDLFMKTEKQERWVLYDTFTNFAYIYGSEEEALEHKRKGEVGPFKIEWEE